MDRKELVRRYKESPRTAGVYRVRHRRSGRTLLGSSGDAPARLNRIRAQLSMNTHPNAQLQADWDSGGVEAFDFEVVDVLAPPDDPGDDINDDLVVLLELWQDKIEPDADPLY